MLIRRSKVPTYRCRLAQAILVGLVFILCGLGSSLWQTVSEMKQDANARLQHASTMMDNALDSAHQAAVAVRGTLGKPCDEVEPMLDEQVTRAPEVRSINLARGDQMYCTSLFGAYHERIFLNSYTDGRLYLMKGNPVTPNSPIIVYREQVGEDSILVVLDAYYLLHVLDILSDNSPLSLVVGRQRWQHKEPPTEQLFPANTVGYLEQASTKYPFRIVTQYSDQQLAISIWRYGKVAVIAFPILGILLGIFVFRLTGRLSSPLRDMQVALSQQEFIPYLQPIVKGSDSRLHGCEVLMRWQHPELGMIPPDRFIPTAEASGLIVPMTRSLMTQVNAVLAPIQGQLPAQFHIGFNISACHCRDLSLVDDCRAFLAAFDNNPIRLVLELTERELLVADEVTTQLFAELRELGVLIAIDDFGTGHSSLTYLQQFKVDILKIDQSFVAKIGSDALSGHIVDSVIDLATRLSLRTVAEGVETEVQASYLREHKVDCQQGYLHSRPMPITAFAKLLVR